MNRKSLLPGALVVLAYAPAFAATASNGCHTVLSSADARMLAAATPNARAFQRNLHASLTTELAGMKPGGAVAVRVVAHEPGRDQSTEVGVYTVNLRSGRITDDDQEPADDTETLHVRDKLVSRHCN